MSRANHLTLGQRLAAVREAETSPAARDALCRRHGISPDTLAVWRHEFTTAGLREIALEDFRGAAATPHEEVELLARIRKLEIMLRARSAEASALRGLIAGRRFVQHLNRG